MIVVRRAPLKTQRAILQFGPLRIRAAIGKASITACKREGDGATPRAVMRLISAFRRGERAGPLSTTLPVTRIQDDMLWCDDPRHSAYNRKVRAPFSASHETLKRKDSLYDVCVVLDWNITSRKRGAGSAIFFHIARPDYAPTEGCVAISYRDMLTLMPHLHSGMRLQVL